MDIFHISCWEGKVCQVDISPHVTQAVGPPADGKSLQDRPDFAAVWVHDQDELGGAPGGLDRVAIGSDVDVAAIVGRFIRVVVCRMTAVDRWRARCQRVGRPDSICRRWQPVGTDHGRERTTVEALVIAPLVKISSHAIHKERVPEQAVLVSKDRVLPGD